MDLLEIFLAIDQPDLLPLLMLLERQEDYMPVNYVSLDISSVDLDQNIVNIEVTVSPLDATLSKLDVVTTSDNYNGVIIYDDDVHKHYLKLTRIEDIDAACEVYVQQNGHDVLTELSQDMNYFIVLN